MTSFKKNCFLFLTRVIPVLLTTQEQFDYTKKYYKVIQKNNKHYGHTYHHGLNVDSIPFSPEESCLSGGLYFTNRDNLRHFLHFGEYICEVSIPIDTPVWEEKEFIKKWKAPQLFVDLENRCKRENFAWTNDEILCILTKLRTNECDILISQKKEDDLIYIVSKCGSFLKYIPFDRQTYSMCKSAVKNDPFSFNYSNPKYHTSVLSWLAFEGDHCTFPFIPQEHITEDMCIYLIEDPKSRYLYHTLTKSQKTLKVRLAFAFYSSFGGF